MEEETRDAHDPRPLDDQEAACGETPPPEAADAGCESEPPQDASTGSEQPPAGDDLVGAFAAPFQDTQSRFWEKAAAFWAINLLGLAAAATVTWLGWHAAGPLVACAIACGLTAGVTILHAIPLQAPRAGRAFPVLLPIVLASLLFSSFLLTVAHYCLFRPSTAEIVAVSALCYFAVYCLASFVGPLGAFAGPRRWLGEARYMTANWHRAAGVVILTSLYLAAAVPAGLVLAPVPRVLGAQLAHLSKKPMLGWLAPLAETSRMMPCFERGFKPPSDSLLCRALSTAARRCAAFLVAAPSIVIGSWYAILSTAAHLLAQLGSVCLVAAITEE